MKTMVCFSAADTEYCLPVEATRAVRTTVGLAALPQARRGVTGVIAGSPPLTVICPLGSGGSHILVLRAQNKTFGLQVDAVTSLYRVDDREIGPAPDGQSRRLVSGTVERDGQLLLITDPDALAALL
jgi:chemotaxis signal transduction protein